MKGLVDSAGDRGERDDATLVARVSRAVFGYLEHVSSDHAGTSAYSEVTGV
ncbi:hypothetical protein JRI60_24505 [Archangium violaceum]|uniref:hypothetical protein n=1 Tax=Archangium violaceum TaxID=83451 RepID=UPI001950C680|nr:hypothetical protein [Archangium violaceum]QRO01952.1 hypothetical protein JRI60_24505 [Archangium violaceum]